MSRYGYDYSLMPSRPTGWRSVFSNVLMVGAIAAVSAISGGVVALELLGPPTSAAGAPAITAAAVAPAPARAARVVTPRPSQQVSAPTTVGAAMEQPELPAAAAQPAAAPAPQSTPVVALASADEQAAAPAPESDLTFTSGYARRRAVHAATQAALSQNIDVAKVESEAQVGRAANKAKPKVTVARTNGTLDQPRTADARGSGGTFEQSDKFDFARHQALAFGDPRQNRRAAPQQGGGLFSNSSGGFFRGLF